MLADGGDCLADLRAVGDQAALFGSVASHSTAFRVIDRIAATPGLLDALRDAHARARARVWELAGAPERLTIDLDATLITAHSEKEGAAGTFKGGYGFAPMLAYGDETGEALAGELRPGNAGANNATDQIAVAEQALAQIPAEHIETIELLLRVDSAGASHELMDWCREGQIAFSVGYDLTETVRAAILKIRRARLGPRARSGRTRPRPTGRSARSPSTSTCPAGREGTRVIVRRERAHPGAQLSFTDHDGHRFQAILTDQTGHDSPSSSAITAAAHASRTTSATTRPPACATCRSATSSTTRSGSRSSRLAHDLIAWTQPLLLTGELATAEPKRLRYRLLHIAARLAFHARTATLRLPASWPWAEPARRRLQAPQHAPRASLTLPARTPTTNTCRPAPAKPARKPARDHRNSGSRSAMASTRPQNIHHQPAANTATETLTPSRLVHDPG